MTDEIPSGPANLLLETDGHDDCEAEACMALSGVDDPDAVDVVFVTFTKSADQRLAAWRDHADAPPANIGIVSVEMGGANGGAGTDRNAGPAVRRISDPSDLTGVGIAISEFLSAWADTDQQTVVCFDSVTALLQYVDANRVFQFLNEMTSKFEQAGAHAHFHLLPEAHEPQNLSVLASLFGERTSAASVVGDDPEATTDADDGDASTTDAGGFVFGGGTDGTDEFVFGDETDGTDDAADASDPDDGAEADETSESPLIETSDSEDSGDADVDLGSTGRSLLDDDDGDETDDEAAERSEESDDEDSPVVGPPIGPGPKRKTGAETGAKQPNDRSATASASATMSAAANPTTASSSKTASSSGATDDERSTGYRTALYSRTTATVVGVVVMLVLISFLAAAMPIPMGDDAGIDDGGNAITTPTPDPAADSATDGTTPTEALNPTPTATPTPTPAPTATPEPSTGGGSDSTSTDESSSASTDTPAPTETPAPTDTPTSTPTPTPEGGDLTDTVDDTVNDTTDTVDDTVDDTTDTVDDTLSSDDDDLL
ncbi:DUF7504 family protein [Natronomonas amylolytica]|uniref:DUF7504 family protein n=1 Tax=Natronomonas amylolytica TaxID=3108498 RepID=UPI0030095360